ncbi:hypothetical protein TIFTF001_004705 [Ficus carica]|uniref:RNase H type-1 domain-containing protein n=1 Tax=Ficus carica TaxID=3494 RepID=A0AA87ZZ65_FICCA|nr:hypothetical protein TIFTF001_004705 [Ficus carica]
MQRSSIGCFGLWIMLLLEAFLWVTAVVPTRGFGTLMLKGSTRSLPSTFDLGGVETSTVSWFLSIQCGCGGATKLRSCWSWCSAIRDDQGLVSGVLSKALPGNFTPLLAEFLALREGLRLVMELNGAVLTVDMSMMSWISQLNVV